MLALDTALCILLMNLWMVVDYFKPSIFCKAVVALWTGGLLWQVVAKAWGA